MCGICGIVGRDPVDREALARMTARPPPPRPRRRGLLRRRARRRARGRPRLPAAVDHRPRRRQPADRERGRLGRSSSSTARSTTSASCARSSRRAGHRFATNADTEVIVHLYEERGRRLRRAPERHVRVRALGRRAPGARSSPATASARSRSTTPSSAATLLFGSELKALLEHPRVPARARLRRRSSRYLALEYVPTPHSIFAGVRKLAGGHVAALARRARSRSSATGTSRSSRRRRPRTDDEYVEELRERLRRGRAAAPRQRRPARASS